MARGASAHFFLKGMDYQRYYPLVLGVMQNYDFLVADANRLEDRSFLKAMPRSGYGPGVEVEIRRRPRGVDVHVLVAPQEDFPEGSGRFLIQEGAFASLQHDATSLTTLTEILPSLKREEHARRDPHFSRTPLHIPDWMFFDLRGGAVMWILGTVLGTIGAAYLLFWAADGAYRGNQALMGGLLFVLAPWFSGIFGRTAARGTAAGFLAVFLPVLFYAVDAIGLGLPGLRRPPGISVIDGFLGYFPGALGLAVPVALGFLGAVTGAIAGAVGGKIFPVKMDPRGASAD